MANVNLIVPANQSVSRILVLNPFYQGTSSLFSVAPEVMPCGITTSSPWQAFSQVYEDVRLIGVRYAIQMRSTIPADFPQVTFTTSWRRNFPASNLAAQLFPAEITGSASAMQVSAINNTVNKLVRSCYPSDLMERIDFHNAESSTCAINYYNQATAQAQQGGFVMLYDQYSDQSEPHPTFSPTLFLVCDVHSTTAAARQLQLTITCYATVEFRGPKFGAAGAYSKGDVLIARDGDLPPDHAPDADDGDMDDGEISAAAAPNAGLVDDVPPADSDLPVFHVDAAPKRISRQERKSNDPHSGPIRVEGGGKKKRLYDPTIL